MKKIFAFALVLVLALSLVACSTPASSTPAAPASEPASTASVASTAEPAGDILIGSCIYLFSDTFMTGVRNTMTEVAATDGATLELVDSQDKQPTQNEQVDTFITKGVNALAINPVDRTAAGPIIEKAMAANLPIVFLNREPEEADMALYDKVWYVGARAEESGTMSGQIIADYFTANPDADKNGDGAIQYVMLQGQAGHQDATLRTEYSVKAIQDAGFEVEELASDIANWQKVEATDLMNNWITSQGIDTIEAVLANNDDMALGAIEALKSQGYNTGDPEKYIPVVGVDATAPALAAMEDGSLLGTVLNDATNQGTATMKIAIAAAKGETVDSASIGYPVTDIEGTEVDGGKYVWIPYVKVTEANYTEYM